MGMAGGRHRLSSLRRRVDGGRSVEGSRLELASPACSKAHANGHLDLDLPVALAVGGCIFGFLTA